MKIDFRALNDNLGYQKLAIKYMQSITEIDEHKALIDAIELLGRFNDSMIALYESSEVELK
jgi:hypothetical protein